MERIFFILGSISALIGVAAGAFGAHGLEGSVSADRLAVWETAARYQLVHALGLLAAAWASTRWRSRSVTVSGWLFVVGTALFSGSLYALVLTGSGWLGAITPLGGIAFLAGWACLAWAAYRG